MDECYEFALLFRFVFLNIGRGDVRCFVVGFCCVVAVIQAWRIPCLLLWNGVCSSFCFHFRVFLVDSFGMWFMCIFLDVWREEVGSLWEGMTTFLEQLSCLVVLSSELSRPSLVTTSPRSDNTLTDLRWQHFHYKWTTATVSHSKSSRLRTPFFSDLASRLPPPLLSTDFSQSSPSSINHHDYSTRQITHRWLSR